MRLKEIQNILFTVDNTRSTETIRLHSALFTSYILDVARNASEFLPRRTQVILPKRANGKVPLLRGIDRFVIPISSSSDCRLLPILWRFQQIRAIRAAHRMATGVSFS